MCCYHLQFAQRAKKISNKPVVNEVGIGRGGIEELSLPLSLSLSLSLSLCLQVFLSESAMMKKMSSMVEEIKTLKEELKKYKEDTTTVRLK